MNSAVSREASWGAAKLLADLMERWPVLSGKMMVSPFFKLTADCFRTRFFLGWTWSEGVSLFSSSESELKRLLSKLLFFDCLLSYIDW